MSHEWTQVTLQRKRALVFMADDMRKNLRGFLPLCHHRAEMAATWPSPSLHSTPCHAPLPSSTLASVPRHQHVEILSLVEISFSSHFIMIFAPDFTHKINYYSQIKTEASLFRPQASLTFLLLTPVIDTVEPNWPPCYLLLSLLSLPARGNLVLFFLSQSPLKPLPSAAAAFRNLSLMRVAKATALLAERWHQKLWGSRKASLITA